MEEVRDTINEKAIKAKIPSSATGGIENQYEESPLNKKPVILKPGTTRVTT